MLQTELLFQNNPSGNIFHFGQLPSIILDLRAAQFVGTKAGGDLSGLFPNPTIASLAGHALSSATPSLGQALIWNGTAWTPTSVGGTGTVTNIATAGLISGGPITTTGTITTSMNTNRLVGRETAGVGIMEEISLGTGLNLSALTLSVTPDSTNQRLQAAWNDNTQGTRHRFNFIDTATIGWSIIDDAIDNEIEVRASFASMNISQFTNDAGYITNLSTFDTDDLSEGATNLYFTETRVRATLLSGLSITGSSITAADSVLSAFGKLQNQINGVLGGAIYQGTWNALTNSPALASGTGTKGYYYVVNVAGATNLDGITDWKVGDWAIFNGTVWEKVDNTDAVSSVNSAIGAVSLTGTSNRITVSGTVWDIAATYVGQTSINTLGTITTGVWTGTTIAVTSGGTGLTAVSQGDILYGSAANTLSALAKDTGTTRYLSNTGTSNNPAWAQVALSTGISGFGANVATFLATPTSANLAAAVTDETGTGALVFATSPGFTTAANPVSDDGATLGTTSLKWSDLFLASGAVINFNSGNVTLTHAAGSLTVAGGGLVLAAGTTTLAPLTFTSGTNLTTAAAGVMEFDGTCFYATALASSRQVSDCEQFICLTSSNTLTNQTGAQAIFDGGGGPANGAVTIQTSTTYFFTCSFQLTSMGASNSFGFAFAGGATFTQSWNAIAGKIGAGSIVNAQTSWNTSANTAIASSSTATAGQAYITGTIRCTGSGTLIPQVSLGTAAAAVVSTNSYFRIWPVGTNSVVNVGNWS